MAIWQDLVSSQGFVSGYQSVKKGEASLGKAAELAGLPLGQMMMVLKTLAMPAEATKLLARVNVLSGFYMAMGDPRGRRIRLDGEAYQKLHQQILERDWVALPTLRFTLRGS